MVVIGGGLAFLAMQQPKLKAVDTDCFNISVPAGSETYKTSNACQFVAYKGQKSSPDAQILVTSVAAERASTIAEAKSQLQSQNPGMSVEKVEVGGYPAVMQEGVSNGGGRGDRRRIRCWGRLIGSRGLFLGWSVSLDGYMVEYANEKAIQDPKAHSWGCDCWS